MRLAKIVFLAAGIWGMLVITPLYFLFGAIGRQDPPPITHPGFFYGFASVAFAWQLAFFVIATAPSRYRPMMLPSMFAKFSYGIAVVVLVLERRMHAADVVFGGADLLLGLLFVVAYFKTSSTTAEGRPQGEFQNTPVD